MEEKIEYYYNKLLEIGKYSMPFIYERDNLSDLLKESVTKIVEENNEHLLTDSLLDYVTCTNGAHYKLNKLAGNIEEKVAVLMGYFESIIEGINKCYNTVYLKTMDRGLEGAVSLANMIINDTCHDGLGIRETLFLYYAALIILSYYVIKKREYNINDLFDKIYGDVERTLEGMRLRDIPVSFSRYSDREQVIEYVLAKLEEEEIKEIK